jgi:hypothetical protein
MGEEATDLFFDLSQHFSHIHGSREELVSVGADRMIDSVRELVGTFSSTG